VADQEHVLDRPGTASIGGTGLKYCRSRETERKQSQRENRDKDKGRYRDKYMIVKINGCIAKNVMMI